MSESTNAAFDNEVVDTLKSVDTKVESAKTAGELRDLLRAVALLHRASRYRGVRRFGDDLLAILESLEAAIGDAERSESHVTRTRELIGKILARCSGTAHQVAMAKTEFPLVVSLEGRTWRIRRDVLGLPIEEIGISVRVVSALEQLAVHRIGDLAALDTSQLTQIQVRLIEHLVSHVLKSIGASYSEKN